MLLLRTSHPGVAFWPEGRPFKKPDCQVLPPLGLLYLASVVRKEMGRSYPLRVESLSTAVKDEKEILPWIKDAAPDVLALSSMTVEEEIVLKVIECARKAREATLIILGGPYPTFQPEESLRRTGADLVVLGEGEGVIVPLLRALGDGGDMQSVPGIGFMKKGKFHSTPHPGPIEPLDSVPYPAWDLIPIEVYSKMYNMNGLPLLRFPYVPLITSRGCPFRCSFCHNMFGRKFRGRSAQNVLEEIELLHDKFGVREFHVVDDIFNFDGRRVEEICHGIIKRGLKISLAFPNGLRGDILTKKQIKLLKRAGCYSLVFSLESASARILKRMRKKLNLDKLEKNACFASSLDIITKCIFMVGYPGETKEEMLETLRWVKESSFDLPQHSIACPLPGTEMERHAVEFNPDYKRLPGHTMGFDLARNLTTMDPGEFKMLLVNGEAEIFTVPRRAERLRRIRQWWGREAELYFDYALDGSVDGFPVRGGRSEGVHTKELKKIASGVLSSGCLGDGWKIRTIQDSIIHFQGPGEEDIRILVTCRDDKKERLGFSDHYNLSYIPGKGRPPNLGKALEDIVRAFRIIDTGD